MFRYLPLCFTALFCSVVFYNSAAAQIDFDFPDDDVPVLRVDEYYSEANKDKPPMLLVYPDGRVVRSVSALKTEDYECTLSADRFEEFLAVVFEDNDFATISEEEIKQSLSPKREARTLFRVTTNTSKESHVVSFGDSWLYNRLVLGRRRYKKAEHVQRFLKVEDEVRELAGLALMGGEEGFQDTVKQASEKFQEAYPDGPAITDADLYSVRLNREGKVDVRFRVDKLVVDPDPVSVWVTKTKGEFDPSIKVKIDKPIIMNDVRPNLVPRKVK